MQCILCGQESAYHRVITTAWINGLPQAFQMQTKDSIVGKVACRPCYRLGEQIVQKLKALRESLGVLKDITGIALDATVRGQETELLDQVPPLESPVETTDLRKRPLTSPDISASKRIDTTFTPDKEQPPHSRRSLFGPDQAVQSSADDSPRVQVGDIGMVHALQINPCSNNKYSRNVYDIMLVLHALVRRLVGRHCRFILLGSMLCVPYALNGHNIASGL